VKLAEEKGIPLDGLTIEDFKLIDHRIDSRIHKVLSVEASVRSRKSYGGTAPENVLAQAARWKSLLTGTTVEPRKAKVSLGGGHGDGGVE
jgi:argininosuccinate lyase